MRIANTAASGRIAPAATTAGCGRASIGRATTAQAATATPV